MDYKGYSIDAVEEQSLNTAKEEVVVTTYKVSVGDKVVNVGLVDEETAKKAVDARIAKRLRLNLDPAG